MSNNFEYDSLLERVASKVYIPSMRHGNMYITAVGEIVFLSTENMPASLFMMYDGKKLHISAVSLPKYEQCSIAKWRDGGRSMASMKMPKSMNCHCSSLLKFTAVGFISGVLVSEVHVVTRDSKPKSLVDRFVFNSSEMCAIDTREEDGDVCVEDNSPLESMLYIGGELVCVRQFDFAKNACTMQFATKSLDKIKKVSESYRYLTYDNRHVREQFTGKAKQ